MRWEKIKVEENICGPGKRWGHTCNVINGGKMVYLFGGFGANLSHSNHLHVFHSESQTWSRLVVKGTPPTPRDNHTCTAVGDNLFAFGGTDGLNPLRDLHVFNTSSNTWMSPYVGGDVPEAREGHSAVVVGKRLFIFGGCGKSMNHSVEVHYNNLYILDTERFVWQRAMTSGIPPTARDSHTCSSWKNKMIVIAGQDEHGYILSDVHILDTDTLVWKELNTSGQLLTPRGGHSSVAFGKHILVFGGFNDAQNLSDDLYMLDVDTAIWTKINPNGDLPSRRFSMSGACLDPTKNGVLLFIGGCNKYLEPLDDIYYLHTELQRDDGRDERWLDKLSNRKQLNFQSREHDVISPENDRALVTFEKADHDHGNPFSLPHTSNQSRQYFHLNMYRPPNGNRTFQAKVTKNFANGFTIETIIDGKPLRGILFSTSSQNNLNQNGKSDANNVGTKMNEKQDSFSRSPISHQPNTEVANTAASKIFNISSHPSLGQTQKVIVRRSEDLMEPEAEMTDQAASSLNLSTAGEISAALPTTTSQGGQILTGDST